MNDDRRTSVDVPGGPISVMVDGDSSDVVVLAPGAGADMQHQYMSFFARGLADQGLEVVRFNFLYAEAGRKSPDRQPVLEDTYRGLVDHVRQSRPGRLFLGGKSMGGRIASHIAASGTECDGLVFLGYPLHPPGKPERLRDEHLAGVRASMLFVEGTRDPFCPLGTLDAVIAKRGLDATVHVVADGDHSHKVRKSSGRTTQEAWAEAVEAITEWIDKAR